MGLKKSWLVGLAVISLIGFAGCSKKNDLSDNPDAAVGIYKSTGEEILSTQADYFFVSAETALYVLIKDQTEYKRDWKGDLAGHPYNLSEGNFESGNVIGKKMSGTEPELPANLRLMVELNQLALQLKNLVNGDGIKVSFRLDEKHPSFNENLRDILQKLVADKSALVSYMKSQKLEEFWIMDTLGKTRMFKEGDSLRLPTLNIRGDEVQTNLRESKNID